MIYGSYNQRIEWDAFKVKRENLTETFQSRSQDFGRRYLPKNQFATCGSGALSLLTGLPPTKVESHLPKTRKHWSQRAAINFLRSKGFLVQEISRYSVTNLDPTDPYEWRTLPVNSHHVLLCDLLMCRDEGSWWVVHNNFSYHNFEVNELHPLLFCNKPSQSIYLVTHPKWPKNY